MDSKDRSGSLEYLSMAKRQGMGTSDKDICKVLVEEYCFLVVGRRC